MYGGQKLLGMRPSLMTSGVQTELRSIEPIDCVTTGLRDTSAFSTSNHDPPTTAECKIHLASPTSSLFLPGKVEGHALHYLIDTGCSLNLLSKRIFDLLPVKVTRGLQSSEIKSGTLADGSGLEFYGQVELNGRIRSETAEITFIVADIEPDAILGMPFLRDSQCQVNCADSVVELNKKRLSCTNQHGVDFNSKVQLVADITVPPRTEQMINCRLVNVICKPLGMITNHDTAVNRGLAVAASLHACDKDVMPIRCINPMDRAVTLLAGTVIANCMGVERDQLVEAQTNSAINHISLAGSDESVPDHLKSLYEEAAGACPTPQQRQKISLLLRKYGDVFSCGDNDQGKTDLVTHSIELQPGTRPIKQAPRRQGPEKEAEIERQVQKLEQQGIIEPACGAWSSPVVLVKKKDGSWRFCIDYRRLNAVTVQDAYPLPRIDESLEALAGSHYFSTLDLMSGYWQVPLDEDAKIKSAFCTRGGLWKWRVLPFGLTAAPATFQRLMERVLHGLHWKTLLLYLDDVIVIEKDFDSHMSHLEEVLVHFRFAGLKLKPSKCHLFQTKFAYLGNVVSKDGVATDPAKVSAVADWPVPQNLKELQAFIGTAGYYRQYVENFASKARPLTKLNNPDIKFSWNEECQAAFDELKKSLLTAPVLGYPDPAISYILDTDASLEGIGAVLSQVQNGKERVVSYYSRVLSTPERNYCVTRRELLAVVRAVEHFRPYLYGGQFKVRTDHASLLWLCRRTTPTAQTARWLEILSEFQFIIEHRPGSKHSNADGLSRRPCRDCKQCDRLEKACGGPSMDMVQQELQDQTHLEDVVQIRVKGEQLGAPCEPVSLDCRAITPGQDDCASGEEIVGAPDHLCAVHTKSCEENASDDQSCDCGDCVNTGCSETLAGDVDSEAKDRQPVLGRPPTTSDIVSEELSAAQQEPSDLAIIYTCVQEGREIDQAVVSLGSNELKKLSSMLSLMRIREDRVLVTRVIIGQRTREVVVCPAKMRKDIIWATHKLSHAGFMKTLKRLRLIWFWPGMTSDIRRLVKSCEVCQTAKSGGLHRPFSQGPLWVGRPWQKVAIDLLGPLPVTPKGNKWILVLVDHFTRWQDAIALPDATAPVVADALDKVFSYFGLPEELHSDRGTQFESELMTELCDLMRVVKTRTSAYHPQSNGMVERGNRTLGDSLRALLYSHAQDQESWDVLLPQIMRSFRATPHSKTEETANFLMFGRECRLPDQLIDGTHSVEETNRTDYGLQLRDQLESAYKLLRLQQITP